MEQSSYQDLDGRLCTAFEVPYQNESFVQGSNLANGDSDVLGDQFADPSITFEGFDGSMPLMSPRTLWFDPFNEEFPLFSTIDASTT